MWAIAVARGTEVVALSFGQRLREARIRRGHGTARALANRIGVNENTYSAWERDEHAPDLEGLARLCLVLDVPASALLGFGAGTFGLLSTGSDKGGFREAAGAAYGDDATVQEGSAEAAALRIASLAIQADQMLPSLSNDPGAASIDLSALQTRLLTKPFLTSAQLLAALQWPATTEGDAPQAALCREIASFLELMSSAPYTGRPIKRRAVGRRRGPRSGG